MAHKTIYLNWTLICFTVKKVLCIKTEMLFSRIIFIVDSPSVILLDVKALFSVFPDFVIEKVKYKTRFFYCFFIYY